MVTLKEVQFVTGNTKVCDLVGKSTDTKPIQNMSNGSTFYELDSSNLYVFDGETGNWVKQGD